LPEKLGGLGADGLYRSFDGLQTHATEKSETTERICRPHWLRRSGLGQRPYLVGWRDIEWRKEIGRFVTSLGLLLSPSIRLRGEEIERW